MITFIGSDNCNTGHILSLEELINPLLKDLANVVNEAAGTMAWNALNVLYIICKLFFILKNKFYMLHISKSECPILDTLKLC